ncbi:MAG: DUF5011 domain-containing protein [Chitinophagales bacterium]
MRHLFTFQYFLLLFSITLFGQQDNNPPTITIIGPSPVVYSCGVDYIEFGAIAFDVEDGTLPVEITEDCVCTSMQGAYIVNYSVVDSDGNCTSQQRLVIVQGVCNEPCEGFIDCANSDPCSNDIGDVWPGDTNNDGIANNFDLLPIGIAYGNTGSPRVNPTLAWVGQVADDWTDTLADGVNYRHIDCNGDGEILLNDIEGIIQNYGETHAKKSSNSGSSDDTPLYVELPDSDLNQGDSLTAPIIFGTAEIPATNVYGIAFTVNFDSELVAPESVAVTFEECWLGTEGSNLITLSQPFGEEGAIDVAITRIDLTNQTGYGTIGTLTGIIDNIAGKKSAQQDLTVTISNIRAISANETEIPVFPTADTVIVTDIRESLVNDSIEMFPNPAKNHLSVRIPDLQKVHSLQLYNLVGGLEKNWTVEELSPQNVLQLDLSKLQSGVYFLVVDYDGVLVSRKAILE